MRYIYLVKSIAIQMRDIYMNFAQIDDIVNEGVIAIMAAIDKYNPEKNVKFETYISKRLKGMIIDLARKNDWVPRTTRKNSRDIEDAVTMLYNELGYYPSVQEVADYLEISVEKYQEVVRKSALFNILSLDMVLAGGAGEWDKYRDPAGEEGTAGAAASQSRTGRNSGRSNRKVERERTAGNFSLLCRGAEYAADCRCS